MPACSRGSSLARRRKRPGSSRRLRDYLLDEGLVSAEDVAMALSLQLNLPIIDLKRHPVQPEALSLVPEEYARQHDLIPIDVAGDSLVVVMADPPNIARPGRPAGTGQEDHPARRRHPRDIREAINRNYRASDEIEEQMSRWPPSGAEAAAEDALTPDLVAQTPIVRTVDLLIAQAVRDRASDIHLEPKEDCLRVRYRIDGILHEVQTLPLSVHPPLISRLKVMAGMNIAERRRPQDGQFSVQIEGKDVDFRVATSDSAHGEMMVLRVLDKSLSLIALEDLGFLPEALERYSQMLRTPFGMVLVGGPTGSGKTTTLYASVNQLDRKERNIVTIEDPDRVPFRRHQPDPGQPAGRHHLRQRAALHHAARPGRDPRRRGARRRDGRDGHAGGPHRPPGALVDPRQRRRGHTVPSHRPGRRAVPHLVGAGGRRLAATGPARVPALPDPVGRAGGGADGLRGGAGREAGEALLRGRLQLLRQHRLRGPDGRVRGHGAQRGASSLCS